MDTCDKKKKMAWFSKEVLHLLAQIVGCVSLISPPDELMTPFPSPDDPENNERKTDTRETTLEASSRLLTAFCTK